MTVPTPMDDAEARRAAHDAVEADHRRRYPLAKSVPLNLTHAANVAIDALLARLKAAEERATIFNQVVADTANELGCKADNEDILFAIAALKIDLFAARHGWEQAAETIRGLEERAKAAQEKQDLAADSPHMMRISRIIEDLTDIKNRFGDTCVYIRQHGLSWGAVALNYRGEDEKHGVFDLVEGHDRVLVAKQEQVERLKNSWHEALRARDSARAEGVAEGRAAIQTITTYDVIAYDEGGYGDNRSKVFDNEEAAIAYARSLEPRFCPTIIKDVRMHPVRTKVKF